MLAARSRLFSLASRSVFLESLPAAGGDKPDGTSGIRTIIGAKAWGRRCTRLIGCRAVNGLCVAKHTLDLSTLAQTGFERQPTCP